jgi:FtsP/CotA-like multicopper oxidase with cupredoxin domain
MSHTKTRFAWTVGVATLIALAVILPRVASSNADEVREIHLVARDMTYYLEGQADPNPTLHVSRGERVRIRLTNRDPGMLHDFGVPAWKKATGLIQGQGEAVVEFRAPKVPGHAAYACTPHGEMMRGTIRIE